MKIHFYIIILIFIVSQVSAQIPGTLDNTFGVNGKVITNLSFYDGIKNIAIQQQDGKILVIGTISPKVVVLRLNIDGSIDPSFGQSGFVEDSLLGEAYGFDIKVQSDGKIIITGYTRYWNGGWREDLFVIRLLSNGSYDNSFGNNGIFISFISQTMSPTKINYGKKIIILPDGSIYIGGLFDLGTSVNPDFAVFKITSNGQFDTQFGINGYVTFDMSGNDNLKGFTIQNDDGKLLITGGMFLPVSAPIIRLNPNGNLDSTFGTNGKLIIDFSSSYQSGTDIKQISNGNILLSGYRSNTSNNNDFFVARIDSTGQIDSTFGTNGFSFFDNGYHEVANSMIELPDKNIMLIGSTGPYPDYTYDILLVCFDSTGILNPAFGNIGILHIDINGDLDVAYCSVMQTDGKIILAGYSIDILTGISYGALVRLYSTYTYISEISNKNFPIILYPNPANDILNIRFSEIQELTEYYEIRDITGKVIIKEKINSSNTTLSTAHFSQSVYLLRIVENGTVVGSKLFSINH